MQELENLGFNQISCAGYMGAINYIQSSKKDDPFAYLGYEQRGSRANLFKIDGYTMRASEGHRIGPLFADNQDIANELLLHLVKPLNGSPFYIDIPDNNLDAMDLVQCYQWLSCFATAQMYRNGRPNIHDDKIYAITNFELG